MNYKVGLFIKAFFVIAFFSLVFRTFELYDHITPKKDQNNLTSPVLVSCRELKFELKVEVDRFGDILILRGSQHQEIVVPNSYCTYLMGTRHHQIRRLGGCAVCLLPIHLWTPLVPILSAMTSSRHIATPSNYATGPYCYILSTLAPSVRSKNAIRRRRFS